jgi:hypothetical protein
VDSMGRSIRPSQIQHWLEAQLGAPLHLNNLRRDELQSAEC